MNVPADPRLAQLARMTGTEILRGVAAGEIPLPPYTTDLGPALTRAEPGRATLTLEPAERHTTDLGMVHGGVIAALCDTAAGYAALSLLPAGLYVISSDLHVKLPAPAQLHTGPVRCTGTAREPVRRRVLAEAEVSGEGGALPAHATDPVHTAPVHCGRLRPPGGVARPVPPGPERGGGRHGGEDPHGGGAPHG